MFEPASTEVMLLTALTTTMSPGRAVLSAYLMRNSELVGTDTVSAGPAIRSTGRCIGAISALIV